MAASLAAQVLGLKNDPAQADAIDKKPPVDGSDELMDTGGLQKKVLEYRGNERKSLLSFGNGAASQALGIK